ncbi:MAG: hypothetical protein N4A45_04520 [Flavobacteriales bacterium]|nr:hypothetical protein [Flavobacteriales bacterium]
MKKYTSLIWAFLVKKMIIYKMDRINILPILLLFLFPNPIFGQKKWVFETTFCDVIIQPKYNDCFGFYISEKYRSWVTHQLSLD